jgi:hypothetical protein
VTSAKAQAVFSRTVERDGQQIRHVLVRSKSGRSFVGQEHFEDGTRGPLVRIEGKLPPGYEREAKS